MLVKLGESILRNHSDNAVISVGEMVNVSVDLVICDDLATARSIELFDKMGGNEPLDKDKIVVTCEHFTPPSTIDGAEIQNRIRLKAKEWGLKHFYELGRSGIGAVVAVNKGLVKPGMLIVGTDPITGALGGLGCYATAIGAGDIAALWRKGSIHLLIPETLKIALNGRKPEWTDGVDIALSVISQSGNDDDACIYEFHSQGAYDLTLDERLEVAYFIMESGATSAIIPPSPELFVKLGLSTEQTQTEQPETMFENDVTINLNDLKPMVALPYSENEIIPVEDIEETKVDLILIGGGLGGTYQNLIELDSILSRNKLHPDVRLMVYPSSSDIFNIAVREGIIGRFVDAGIMVCAPGRGPEGYGNHGISAKNEHVLINGSLNYEGIVGHIASEIYLAGTKTCIASAVTGKITSAREFV